MTSATENHSDDLFNFCAVDETHNADNATTFGI